MQRKTDNGAAEERGGGRGRNEEGRGRGEWGGCDGVKADLVSGRRAAGVEGGGSRRGGGEGGGDSPV